MTVCSPTVTTPIKSAVKTVGGGGGVAAATQLRNGAGDASPGMIQKISKLENQVPLYTSHSLSLSHCLSLSRIHAINYVYILPYINITLLYIC